MRGWVYIITNKAMPNLLKVGFSSKDPKVFRVSELSHTNNPYPFEVQYDVLVHDPRIVEKNTHKLLNCYLEGKEWFRCEVETAILAIQEAADNDILMENFQSSLEEKEEKTFERLDLAISLKQIGKTKEAKIELTKLIKDEPLFTDAYNHLGNIHFENKEYEQAINLYEYSFKNDCLYEIVKKPISSASDFELVTWHNVYCRPFFRAMHGLGCCYIKIGNIKKAIEYFELILKFDANDHFNLSFSLGDLYLKLGNYKKSKKYLSDFSVYSPYKYSLALLYFKNNEFVKALTLLRCGFITNTYIAREILYSTNKILEKEFHKVNEFVIKILGSDCNYESSVDYLDVSLDTWKNSDGAICFLNKAYNNKIIKVETELYFKKYTDLYNAKPQSIERENLITEVNKIENGINDSSSKIILDNNS